MDRDVEEASQGLVSSYHPGEPWPWLCSPCLASGCARFTALDMAWSMPGVGKPVAFPQLWEPSNQAFLWDLEQAWPWRKRSVTENCSRRRHPSPGSSHGGRQCFPGCWEQR